MKSLEQQIEEYSQSIELYTRRIHQLRAQPPPLSAETRYRIAQMEAALEDMQYAMAAMQGKAGLEPVQMHRTRGGLTPRESFFRYGLCRT